MAGSQPNHFVTNAKNYIKTVAREVRDIPTAVGTTIKAIGDSKAGQGGVGRTGPSQRAINAAGSDLKKQVKETIKAATSGKSGTTAAQSKARWQVTPGTKR